MMVKHMLVRFLLVYYYAVADGPRVHSLATKLL